MAVAPTVGPSPRSLPPRGLLGRALPPRSLPLPARPLALPTRPWRAVPTESGALSRALGQLRRDRLTVFAATVLLLLAALAAGADLLAVYLFHTGPTEQDLLRAYARPELRTPALWLGADELGRSQVVRLVYAGRVSLAVGLGAALVNLALGLTLGLLAGYARGRVDDAVQWLVATVRSMPSLFLLLTVSVLFSPGTWTLVLLLGLLSWQGTALFVRGQVFSLREREFVAAARVVGASHTRIVVGHLLPNVLPFAATLAAIEVGAAILAESALSFLGLGIVPPTPSWGNMLTNAASGLARGPWLVWGPGAAIFLTVLCFYLLGDGLRDALDPRLERGARKAGPPGGYERRARSRS